MAKNVGAKIKEARTAAGMTQEQLAKKVKNTTASDISKAERGEKDLTQEQLKEIAKATGVTQKSLLETAKGTASGKKKTGSSMTLTAAEKKVIELYRAADSKTKKAVTDLLKGEKNAAAGNLLGNLLENAVSMFSGKK